ncbi:MAG: hypothetical protein AB8B67_02570 [Rickettsiaceae bacterium]
MVNDNATDPDGVFQACVDDSLANLSNRMGLERVIENINPEVVIRLCRNKNALNNLNEIVGPDEIAKHLNPEVVIRLCQMRDGTLNNLNEIVGTDEIAKHLNPGVVISLCQMRDGTLNNLNEVVGPDAIAANLNPEVIIELGKNLEYSLRLNGIVGPDAIAANLNPGEIVTESCKNYALKMLNDLGRSFGVRTDPVINILQAINNRFNGLFKEILTQEILVRECKNDNLCNIIKIVGEDLIVANFNSEVLDAVVSGGDRTFHSLKILCETVGKELIQENVDEVIVEKSCKDTSGMTLKTLAGIVEPKVIAEKLSEQGVMNALRSHDTMKQLFKCVGGEVIVNNIDVNHRFQKYLYCDHQTLLDILLDSMSTSAFLRTKPAYGTNSNPKIFWEEELFSSEKLFDIFQKNITLIKKLDVGENEYIAEDAYKQLILECFYHFISYEKLGFLESMLKLCSIHNINCSNYPDAEDLFSGSFDQIDCDNTRELAKLLTVNQEYASCFSEEHLKSLEMLLGDGDGDCYEEC